MFHRVVKASFAGAFLLSVSACATTGEGNSSLMNIGGGALIGGLGAYAACKLENGSEEQCRKVAAVGAFVGGVVGKLKDNRDKALRAAALDSAARSNAVQTYAPQYTPNVTQGTITPTSTVARNVPPGRQCKVLAEQLIETSGPTNQETTVCLNPTTSRWEETDFKAR